MNAVNYNEWLHLAHSLRKRGFNHEEISSELQQKGTPENLLQEIIEKAKALYTMRRRKSGFFYCGLGVTLLVVGCMLTLFLMGNGSDVRLVMYGLTSIGVAFTIKGMIDLLGW